MNLQNFAGERTEPATPKKRQDIRKKGQTFQSREITSALIIISGFLAVYFTAFNVINKFIYLFKYLLYNYIGPNDDIFSLNGISKFMNQIFSVFISIVLPIIISIFLVSLISTYAQVGFLFSSEALKIKLNRLNPIDGFKRLFSKRSIVELAKSIIKICVLIYILYSYLILQYKGIPQLLDMTVQDLIKYFLNIFSGILLRITIVLIILGVADYIFQWRDFESNIKMSKEDIKEEFKETEGNPEIKSQIRKRQRQISMRRMIMDIKKADVIITNPTHLAIALMYDNKVSDAPIVIAKGQDYVAEKIKEEAKKYDIIVVENKPLAHALYKSTNIGDSIPANLYKAVAEVLAYVYSLKGD